MRILFINTHFPGFFHALAHHLGQVTGNTVLFLAEKGQKRLPGVRRLRLAPPQKHDATCDDPAEKTTHYLLQRAARAGNALLRLKRDGFSPDVIISHAEDGSDLYVADIFPKALFISHVDWFHRHNPSSSQHTVSFASLRIRNMCLHNALEACHAAVTDSQWQREQFPLAWQSKIHVIPRPIESAFFSPLRSRQQLPSSPWQNAPELISFSCPWHTQQYLWETFSALLPRILEQHPSAHIVWAWPKQDNHVSCIYSVADLHEALPTESLSRVHFLGACPLVQYRDILRASTVHVYGTTASTLSTGILEAMSCGVATLAPALPPVREFLQHGENGLLYDAWEPYVLVEHINTLLHQRSMRQRIATAARQTISQNFTVAHHIRHWYALMTALRP